MLAEIKQRIAAEFERLKQRIAERLDRTLGSLWALAVISSVILAGAWLCQVLASDKVLWYYLVGAYVLSNYSAAFTKKSEWFVFVRDTSIATVIGIGLVLLASDWLSSQLRAGDSDELNEHTIEAARSLEMHIMALHEKLKHVGEIVVYVLPLVLIAMVFAGRAAALKWAGQINLARWGLKILLGGVTIASSFTMFTSDAALGERASDARMRVVATLNRIEEKRREHWLEAARLKLETADIEVVDRTPQLRQALVMHVNQALLMVRAKPEAKSALLEVMGRTIATGSPLEAALVPGNKQEKVQDSTHGITPETAQAMSPEALDMALTLALQQFGKAEAELAAAQGKHEESAQKLTDEIETEVRGDRENQELLSDDLETLGKDGRTDLVKKVSGFAKGAETLNGAISKFIGESLHVPDSIVKLAFEPLIDKLIDVAFDKVSESRFRELHEEFLGKVKKSFKPTDPAAPERVARRSAHALAEDIPRNLLEEADKMFNTGSSSDEALTISRDVRAKINQARNDLNWFGMIDKPGQAGVESPVNADVVSLLQRADALSEKNQHRSQQIKENIEKARVVNEENARRMADRPKEHVK